jgi:hypothetical protein
MSLITANILYPNISLAAGNSTAPSSIIVTNNTGKPDTVDVTALIPGDVVKVYNADSGGKILGTATASNKDEAIVTIAQLGTAAGNVYVSVTSKGMVESDRTTVPYSAEPVSTAPDDQYVTITNNVGKASTFDETNLLPGDIVKVYSAATGGKLLGTGTVPANDDEVIVSIGTLGVTAGSVFASVTSKYMLESDRTQLSYEAEPVSDPPDLTDVTVTNNVGKAGTVDVTNLSPGDILKVYNLSTGGKLIGTSKVSDTSTTGETVATIPQLGTVAGSVYASITSENMLESVRATIPYAAETVSPQPLPGNIIVNNNATTNDTVNVAILSPGDIVKVYDAAAGGEIIGTGTVSASATGVTVKVSQLGITAGTVFVSVTSKGMLESMRTPVTYAAKPVSDDVSSSNVTITNNVTIADTINVTGLSVGDVIKVYNAAAAGNVIGTATVPANKAEVTVSIKQLGATAGSVWISVTSTGMLESDRVEVAYIAEQATPAVDPNNITVTNNVGKAATIDVSGLPGGDTLKIYNAYTGGKLLGTFSVPTSSSEVTESIAELNTVAGSVYVTDTVKGMAESTRTTAAYAAQLQSTPPASDGSTIAVNNIPGSSSTVQVIDLSLGDVVKVYNAQTGGSLLGSAKANSNLQATVTIAQLGTSSGNIYVSITSTGMLESPRQAASYSAQAVSDVEDSANVTVNNNAGAADTVIVGDVSPTDVVKVYNAATGGTLLGSGTVSANSTQVTITITQLGSTAGYVYISVTSVGKRESSRTPVQYLAEAQTSPPSNITVNNNALVSSTVIVGGLSAGNLVKVYDSQTGGNLLGSGTVPANSTQVTVTVKQLAVAGGYVYVSVTSTDDSESTRTSQSYSGQAQSIPTNSDNVTINNNVGAADTIKVTGLSVGDVVTVYDSATGGNILCTGTVPASSAQVTMTVNQLLTATNNVYISVTSVSKLESTRCTVGIPAQIPSIEPALADVTVVNNAGSASTVTVTGLLSNDVVNVYDAGTGGNLLGTATVATYGTQAIVSIAQLSNTAGNVYVSVTSKDDMESARQTVPFSAKSISSPTTSANVTIVNNSGIPATVTVIDLIDGDVVNVYDSAVGGNLLGTATVPTYSTQVVVSVPQLGASAGKVYVTITSKGQLESNRIEADFSAKIITPTLSTSCITVVNNAGIPDTVTVTGLAVGDVINVYDASTGGNLLGSATVPANSMQAVVAITQLGTVAGTIYVSDTTIGKTESLRTSATYLAEQASTPPSVGNITIVNNSGSAATLTVTGLEPNDVVKVYNVSQGGSVLSSATVPANSTSLTLSISALGTTAGSLYITVTSTGMTESLRTTANYAAESIAPTVGNITIVNNTGISSTVTVNGLLNNDLVNVYDAATGGNLLGSASSSGGTQAIVTIQQLTTSAGSVYVSVTSFGQTESARTQANYTAVQTSSTPYIGNITVVNNTGTNDTVTVSSLTANDFIQVYDAATGGILLGSATVPNGSTQATVTIAQLGISSGTIYVSKTSPGKNESSRTPVEYAAEAQS